MTNPGRRGRQDAQNGTRMKSAENGLSLCLYVICLTYILSDIRKADPMGYHDHRPVRTEISDAERFVRDRVFGGASDRNLGICRMYNGGASYAEIASAYGLSRSRVAHIVSRARDIDGMMGDRVFAFLVGAAGCTAKEAMGASRAVAESLSDAGGGDADWDDVVDACLSGRIPDGFPASAAAKVIRCATEGRVPLG